MFIPALLPLKVKTYKERQEYLFCKIRWQVFMAYDVYDMYFVQHYIPIKVKVGMD